MRVSTLPAVSLCIFILINGVVDTSSHGQDAQTPKPAPDVGHSHCLILAGLPGDALHATTFRRVVSELHEALQTHGFSKPNIHVLLHNPPTSTETVRQINREAIETVSQQLVQRLTPDDSFWLIVVGHADHDGEHARLHIPGPDLRAVDYADLFEDLKCEEQVFWITTSSSGWFTEPLSKEKRIIVTATARDAEPNETEFPYVFSKALAEPKQKLDRNENGSVSVLELFARTHELVIDSYALDERAPTEHATIDDDGDGKGTEWKEILAELTRIQERNVQKNADGVDATASSNEASGKQRSSGKAGDKQARDGQALPFPQTKLEGRFASSVKIPWQDSSLPNKEAKQDQPGSGDPKSVR